MPEPASPADPAVSDGSDERVWRYRAHLRYMHWVALVLTCIVVFGGGGWTIILWWTGAKSAALFESLVFTIVFGGQGALFTWLFRRFAHVRLSLTDTMIRYENVKGVNAIPIDEVTALGFSHVRQFGGWLKITSHHDTIRLTVVLEDLAGFVIALHERLDARVEPLAYDRARLGSFLRTAASLDYSWDRVYQMWPWILGWTGIGVGAGFVVATAFGVTGGMHSVLMALSVGWALVSWMVLEMICVSRDGKRVDVDALTAAPRDLEAERRVFWCGTAVAIGAWTVLATVIVAMG